MKKTSKLSILALLSLSTFALVACTTKDDVKESSGDSKTSEIVPSSENSSPTSSASSSEKENAESSSSKEETPASSSSKEEEPITPSSSSEEEKPDTRPIFEMDGSKMLVYKEGVARFEAEDVDRTSFVRSSDNPTDIVSRSDASGGKFLAASTGNTSKNSTFKFTLDLDYNAKIKMKAAYSQPEKWKTSNQDLTKSYTYVIDENKNMPISSNKTVLAARDDITKWDTFDYDEITLPKGAHSFSVKVLENTGKGNPNIDYFDFTFEKVNEVKEDGDSVPSNDFHCELQYKYINDSNVENVTKYANGVAELSRPKGITIPLNSNSSSLILEYADNSSFTNSIKVEGITSKSYTIQNLKLGQKLYWRYASTTNELSSSKVNEMQIASKGPRNIYIEDVSNVRDIGGYTSSLVTDGKIRQGLYYRGANLNSIKDAGKNEMRRLGIKQEIDLRDANQCNGPYVGGIDYKAVSIPSGTESTRFEAFASEYKTIFSMIEKANEKPIYLHCTAGADRTGISTFMLLTVCGANYDDIARDYLFTNFSTQGSRISNFQSEFKQWWSKLDNFDGSSKADKAKSWLISKGVTSEQVENIRSIFVENYK